MNEWVERYFNRMKVLGYSIETQKSHRWRLPFFLAHLESLGVKDVSQITPALVRGYQNALFEKVNQYGRLSRVSYRNNLLLVAKQFLKFLAEEGAIPEDPGKGVEYAIEPKRLPRYVLTENETRKLLAVPDLETTRGYRDRAILELFYSSGIRRSELIGVRLGDLDLEAGLLRINAGKGNKDRVVPVGQIALKYLKGYIQEIRPHLVKHPQDDHLFLSQQGTRISKCMMGLRLKEYAKKAGIEKDISVHTLRATCATHCLRGKRRGEQMHPRHLMELMGHSSMEALNPYLSVSIPDLKEAHNRCHPREKLRSLL